MAKEERTAARDKRERLVSAAVALAYRQGFGLTTLADIAAESSVPLGNVYYYFKTREDIRAAILTYRKDQFAQARDRFGAIVSPKERLKAFVDMTVSNADNVAQKGCPMGTLCAELLKMTDAFSEGAGELLTVPMAWMKEQFIELGYEKEANDLALQLQAGLQGASMVTLSARDPSLLEREGERLKSWIEAL
ncbi:TetR/AcrR family transcriptional regulator [Pelagibacterium lentulum]|uniref:TetR family transcriptional regulator n=1 Tax=Pelagibacterium lentulum TaxID=2029865 RepID=A0A916R8I7_9HYPH|nr:TetR/AcrR family transcriptional regulator [Pelagibacterium lentulum]GGA45566.1 TetR family transcriptional regulator [Pelagibacterium lentulum]